MNSIIKLSPRLAVIAELVPTGSRLADIGTDHGLLPVSLILSGKIRYAAVTDIHRLPLEKAMRLAEAEKISLDGFVCDGFSSLKPWMVDTAVIAGMGGDTIVHILEEAPWAREKLLLILQPMTHAEKLRAYLRESDLSVINETLVLDNKKIYPVIVAAKNDTNVFYTDLELYTGKRDCLEKSPLFSQYLTGIIQMLMIQVKGERSASIPDIAKAEQIEMIASKIRSLKEGLRSADSM